jgi:hypothetical protein
VEETTPSVLLAPFGSSAVDLEGIQPETVFLPSLPLCFCIFGYFFGLLLGHQIRNFTFIYTLLAFVYLLISV